MGKAIRMSVEQILDAQARISGRPSAVQMRDTPVEKSERKGKYGNKKVVDRGRSFDSIAEHRRFLYLDEMQKAGEISDLRCQVEFEIIPATIKPSGGKERPTKYLADFAYFDRAGNLVVEDVKGPVTPEFRIKRKLMLWRHGIEVKEIRS